MRHFSYMSAPQEAALFARAPQAYKLGSDRQTLRMALGATLYTPGTRTDYASRLPWLVQLGMTSSVLCLEDAIADADLRAAEQNVVAQIRAVHQAGNDAAMVFIRVRNAEQIPEIVDSLGASAASLCGFVFPKFTAANGREYFDALSQARRSTGLPFYGMPVLESGETIHTETRVGELVAVRSLLTEFTDSVLTVRIGATDLCGVYGLRRARDVTVYDLAVVREAIADIVNVFARDDTFSVSGPVWEYFGGGERLFKPQLRQSPFQQRLGLRRALSVRHDLIRRNLDGLMREVVLDQATGIVGKTVIHPSHIRPVHALYAVNAEEFADAETVLHTAGQGGARASTYANKMIEARPHARWAELTLCRAEVYGVLRADRTFVDLLAMEDVTE